MQRVLASVRIVGAATWTEKLLVEFAMVNQSRFSPVLWLIAVACAVSGTSVDAAAQNTKPNIIVIMGDDIGMWNIGAYQA